MPITPPMDGSMLHSALQNAAGGDEKLLNDPSFVRGVLSKTQNESGAYADSASGLVPPGVSPQHQDIQDALDTIRQHLATLSTLS